MSEQEKLAAKRMRMLRLGEGWSGERLSQEYAKGGVGALTRTAIAKIEGGKRQIKAGELEGVARVFGLTSADLLGSNGPNIVLEYAEQDGRTGRQISAWLGDRGFHVRPAGPAATDEAGTSSGVAQVIDGSQAFVLLLTPSLLASPRCREDLDVARRHEQQLISASGPVNFIYVLREPDAPGLDEVDLTAHALIDLPVTNERSREAALSKLGSSIIACARASVVPTGLPDQSQADDDYLSRGAELERVLYALRNPSGADFWLVVSPPGFGKSWFLRQLETRAAEPAAGGWAPKMVDLRSGDRAGPDVTGRQHDAIAVIGKLFGLQQDQSPEPADVLVAAAQKIVRGRRPWLCLLDSAELLEGSTVTEVRRHLGEINRLVQNPSAPDARLAFVVASRRTDGWDGISPAPRLSVLPLNGLGPSAVLAALERRTRTTEGVRSRAELADDARLVRGVTEGVPELVLRSLEWIREEEWLAIERLENPQVFGEIITPYIDEQLLVQGSLLPGKEGQHGLSAKPLAALKSALRALVPYRFITMAHVHYHLDNDCALANALTEADWTPDDLWRAIGGTDLLLRPLVEPWQEIHPAIRRLLYRYFYKPGERAGAHVKARDFTTKWVAQLTGKDQVNGMVEAIWHEAARLRLSGARTIEADVINLARELSGDIRPSASGQAELPSSYTKAGLREYAVQRMDGDHELHRELAGVEGLFDRLTQVIREPETPEG